MAKLKTERRGCEKRRTAAEVTHAIRKVSRGLEGQPDDPAGWLLLAELHLENHDEGAALVCLRNLLAIQPQHAHAWFLKGQIEEAEGYDEGYSEALASFGRAICLNPTRAEYWSALEGMRARCGLNTDALVAAERAVALDVHNGHYWFRLGLVQVANDMHQEATESFERAVELDPTNAYGWLRLGDCLRTAYEQAEAYEAYQQAAISGRADAGLLRNVAVALAALAKECDSSALAAEAISYARESVERAHSASAAPGLLETYEY